MVDVRPLIKAKSDQLNSEDLVNSPRTIKITRTEAGSSEQPLKIFFEGDNGKPYKPGKSMMRVMNRVWGHESNDWVGQSMTLYCDDSVKFGGDVVGGIRISHMTGLNSDLTFPLTISRARSKAFTVKPLTGASVASKPAINAADALSDAKLAASKGKDAFTAWWNSKEGKARRHLVEANMGELQEIVAKADAGGPQDDVPFE